MGIRIIPASAGTGKTYTLLNEIFKFEKNEEPTVTYDEMMQNLKETLFLSFSNSAVDEIKRRIFKNILKVLKKENKDINYDIISSINVKTIHSFALDVLKLYRFELGISDDLELLDDEGELWERCVDYFFKNKLNFGYFKNKYGLNENIINAIFLMTDFNNLKKSIKNNGEEIYYLKKLIGDSLFNCKDEVFNLSETDISKIMDSISSIDDWEEIDDDKKKVVNIYLNSILNSKDFFDILMKIIEDIGEDFVERQERNGYYTFDTAVFRMVERIKLSNNRFWKALENEGFCFKNIFFDEVQDNNVIQNLIISYLFNYKIDDKNELNIIIVGDLKQSIYAFRNAIPEYMKKMIEEKNKQEKVKGLKKSWRLENKKLLEDINSICDNIPDWDYYDKNNDSEDRLDLVEEKINPNLNEPIKLFKTAEKKKISKKGKYITLTFRKVLRDNIIQKENLSGRIGVVTYGRNYLKDANFLKKIKELNPNIPINILFEQKISDMRKDKYEETILPELDFIKILYEIINSNPLSLMYLVFTYQGNKILEKFVNEVNKNFWDLEINEKIEKLKKMLNPTDMDNVYIEKDMYNISENLYYNLNDFWNILYHKDIDNIFFGDKDSVVRIINHILYVLYLKETNKRTHYPQTLDFFDFDKLTLPPLNIYFDSNKSEKTIIEVNTIHSSKGLEYDCVIAIIPLNEIFNEKRYLNFRDYDNEYRDFFYINVDKALTNLPEIKINYFPFLKDMRKYLKINDPNHFLISNLKKHLRNDEINKFYVAITRAKKRLIILSEDCPSFLDKYCSEDNGYFDILILNNQNQNNVNDISYLFSNMIPDTQTFITYPYIVQMKKYALKSFRLVNTEGYTSTTNDKISQFENIRRMKEGSLIHNIIEKAVLKQDFSDPLFKEGIVDENEIKEIKNNNSSFLIELPLWRYVENNNRYIYLKGVVDCVGINEKNINLYEFKVVFEDNKIESIKNAAQQQLREYKISLKKLTRKNITEKPIILKAYNRKEGQ